MIVDAAQGVEAQSVANCYTAIDQGLEVIPVLNKIDLPSAEPDRVAEEIEEMRKDDIRQCTRDLLLVERAREWLLECRRNHSVGLSAK